MDNIGGAEMVTLTLARELGATIYTTNVNYDRIEQMGFSDVDIISIGSVPLNPPFRQQMAFLKFRFLDLKGKYDYYICMGDWAMSGCVLNSPNMWYVHSPIREIWDLKEYVRSELCSWWQRPFFDIWVLINRHLNKTYVKKVDTIVCNSVNTQRRVKEYLERDGVVINPPVDTEEFISSGASFNYWLSVNRLLPSKRIAMQIEAFRQMPNERLLIIGSYEESKHFVKHFEELNTDLPDNVQILNFVSRKDLIGYYARCKGLIATAMDEDFGMTPVEAMASGKPVIAANEGGYKETVINGVTGVLIDDISSEKIVTAVGSVGKDLNSYTDACVANAKAFDTKVFVRKIRDCIEKHPNLS